MNIKPINKFAQRGAEMIEYAMVIALIALIVLVALKPLGTEVKLTFTDVKNALQAESGRTDSE